MVGSSCTGQNALLALPSKSWTDKRSADNYSLPKKLVYDKEGLLKKSGGARGLFVWKVTKTGKLQARRLSVTLDRRHLVVTSHRIRSVRDLVQAATGRDASIKQIPFAVVDRIQRGPHTTRFRTAERNNGATLVRRAYAHTVDSLSIVYYSFDTNALETLDIIVPNDVTFVVILTALEDLLALARTERVRYVHSIDYLHYQWARLGKPVRDALALNEWNGWAESVGATLPKAELATMFREDCDMLGHADERLPLPAVVLLLEDVREAQAGGSMEHHPLEALWTVLVRTDPVPFAGGNNQAGDVSRNADLRDSEESISTVAFLSILRSQQKEYQSSLEQVADLVRSLNVQQTPDELLNKKARQKTMQSNGDRLARTRFFSFLMSDANDLLDPLDGQLGVQDMTRPLSHYWINTSHDTFLATTAHSLAGKSRYAKTEAGPEKVDGQMYLTALFRGVRCLELDVWENELLEPVLARYQPIGLNYEFAVPLDDVLRDIRFFLREHPYSFPIILNIENHCSTEGQLNVAKLLYNTLGAAQLILEPEGELHDFATLPSPEAARGKVIVLAKRPKTLVTGCKVRNDDFDDENHTYQPSSHTNDTSVVSLEDDDDATVGTTIVGFNSQGPIKAKDPHAPVPSPAEIVATAQLEAAQARSDAQYAQEKAEALDKLADQKETETSILTAKAGMTATEVKRRAAAAAGRSFDKGAYDADDRPEGKVLKEEGIEMHEILPGVVQGGRDQYARTAQEAMEAGNRVAVCFTRYNQAEATLFEASQNFERARGREQALAQEAQKAAAEARSHREFADSARVRVEQVRELQRNALENTSSAGNVVVTAMTEAKISEKRAADAEARAERAKEAAARDQQRADEETRKEESLENEVTELHAQCSEASEAAKAVRERVEKAATMLDRVNEQIHLIENSSQYRKEVAEGVKGGASVRHGGSFVAKHSSKLEEREICRDLIREASEENATAEARRNRIYAALEDKNHLWNEQREVVAQARRVADRSTHAAEELAEHAEEEREAAMLRYTARQRAEATAENRDSHTQSLQTQLEEAERASTEAANIAVQSRKLATRLLADGEKAKDLDHFVRTMKEAEGARNKAKIEYDAAKLEKDRCNDRMMEEKRRLDTNAEVFTRAQRAAADAVDRIQYEHLYQQEAIVAYNEALMLRSQAEDAARRSKANMAKADEKARAAQSASEYKRLTDRVVELPTNLARLSMLHRLKFQNWEKSLSLSAAHVHSFAQHVLFKMLNDDSLEQCKNIKAFTQNHLCRVFPSWNVLPSKMFTNYDPIFAWSMGCQLVPMNFHSADERLFVADGRFRTNGSCGYVLKPSNLAENNTNSVESEEWSLEVLCGSNIPIKKPKGTPNLFVKVSLFAGSTMKDKSAFYKTSIQHNNANPVWEGNNFVFAVDNPSLAIIVFSVWDQNPNGLEDFIAAAAFPASSLREGYRSVSLFDVHHSRSGPFAFASLLVKALKS